MSYAALFHNNVDSARRRVQKSGPLPVDTSLGTVSLRITGDLQSLEAVWGELQASASCTGAQTFDWAQAWVRHVLRPEGHEAVIVVGSATDGRALFLWPFEMVKGAGMRVLRWLGQEHANYTMGLFAPDAAATFTAADISCLLRELARATGAVGAILRGQPFIWDGIPNPFAKLPHELAPSSGYVVTLDDSNEFYEERFSKRSRSTLDRKERKLANAGRISYGWAETRDERLRIINAVFVQKARQFAAMGIKNIFDAHARAFYREIVLLEGDNPSRLRLGYFKVDDEVLAVFSGTIGHRRMIVVLCSLAGGELRRQSPGALLLKYQIKDACCMGLAFYDFGVGEAHHKDQWADTAQPLFDSFIAFKPRGLTLTLPLAALSRLKRAIKTNRYVWPVAQKLRAHVFGRTGA